MSMVLDHVVATNLSVIQKNLWDPVKRKALVFNRPMEVGDATWQVLRELEVLLDQSQRRRTVDPGGREKPEKISFV